MESQVHCFQAVQKPWKSNRMKDLLVGFGPGVTRQPENSTRARSRAPALQTTPKFHEKTPKRRKKERQLWRKRDPSGPHPSGPHPSVPRFFSSLKRPAKKWSGPEVVWAKSGICRCKLPSPGVSAPTANQQSRSGNAEYSGVGGGQKRTTK